MGKQILGILFFIAGLWLIYGGIIDDEPENQFLRFSGVLLAVSGHFLFLTGIKCQIIDAINNSKQNKEKQTDD